MENQYVYEARKAREQELSEISKKIAQHLCGYGLNVKELRKVMDCAESIILSSTVIKCDVSVLDREKKGKIDSWTTE